MQDLVAVVSTTHREGTEPEDRETRVRTLQDLYEACKEAPPSALVRVSLRGPEGEVVLNFGSFLRK
jgi:hypothetical protein